MNKREKKRWIAVVAVILVVAIAAGVLLAPRLMPQEDVLVYSFDMLGYRNFVSSGTESYGLVTTDRVQSAYVSETQQVMTVPVYQGQSVSKGDVLFTYDTTLSALELERKELEIQQLQINLNTARSDLKALKAMKPMVIPDEPEKEDEKEDDSSKIPAGAQVGKIYNLDSAKGTQLRPYYVWLKSDSSVTEEMIYEYLEARNTSLKEGAYVYVVFRYSSGNQTNAKVTKEYGMRYWLEEEEEGVLTASASSVQRNMSSQLTDPTADSQEPFAGKKTQTGETQATEATEATEATQATEATDPVTPGKPEIPASGATVTADSVTLASPTASHGYTLVYRMRSEGGQWSAWQLYATFDGLEPDTTYYFQAGFVEQDKGGEPVSVSDEVSITTEEAEEPTQPSAPPQDLVPPVLSAAEASVTDRSIILSAPEKPAGYESVNVEYQCITSTGSWQEASWQTSRIFDGLQPNTAYYFRARYVTEDANASDVSNVVEITTKTEEKYTVHMRFYDPSSRSQANDDDDNIVWNSGYTASELSGMKAEKTAQIEELQFQIKIGKAELKIMEKEADSGEVVAQFDGIITSVLEPEDALALNAPLVKLAGGGGFYVEGSVSELDLSTIRVGQMVTVTSWDNYMTYNGTIVEIGDYPTQDENYFAYGAASNLSYYPYKVFIDESADLQEGAYVSMTYQVEVSETEGSLYLENAFLRSENGEYYVYVRGAEGLLEKRTVQVGDASDGYMTEILSGVSETDYLAFPYGNALKEGAPTVEGTWEDLYGY